MFGCNNELDMTTEYKSFPFVYSILNQDDTAHFVRLGRSFQAESDVNNIEHISDSIYFDSAIVKFSRIENNTITQTIELVPDYSIPKEPGFFPRDFNLVYSTSEKLFNNNQYKLSIFIPEIQQEITSSVTLFDDVKLKEEFYSPLFKLNFVLSTPQIIAWYKKQDVRAYDIFLRFHFREIYIHDTTAKYIEIPIRSISNNPNLYQHEMTVDIASSTFYGQVSSNLEADLEIRRIFDSIDICFDLYGKEYYSFLEISKYLDDQGLTFSSFDFDNIENGTGIFSNRKTTIISGFQLTNRSIDKLSCDEVTKALNFADHEGFFYCLNE